MNKLLLSICLLFSISGHCFVGHSVEGTNKRNVDLVCAGVDNKSVDMDCIEKQLAGDGLGGWVHAAIDDQLMFVFTWRRPGNFFINIQLPMMTKDHQVFAELKKLRRHDQIIVRGKFFKNDAPNKHINVTQLEVVKAYTGLTEDFNYDPDLPSDIINGTSLVGKIHAVANGGRVLVVEVGDRVYPVFNQLPQLVKDLYRNDKIELRYYVELNPGRPTHLEVNKDVDSPVTVLESIVDGHGSPITLRGPLVMFAKSPQIVHNVYALQTEDTDGVKRNYTLVNFDDIALYHKIRLKLEETWNQSSASMKYDRNKFVNPKVIIEATGTKHVVSPVQANPQILVEDLKDITIQLL